jgi:FkbM family methyltransferase
MPRVRIEINSRPAFVIHTYGRRDAIISAAIAKYGSWDSASTEIIRKLLEHDADFVDIGANIGWFTLVAAHALGRRGRVHSFEPDPRHVAKIRAAVRQSNFDNVIVNAWALADRAGEERLYRSETNFGDHRLFDLDEPRRSVKVAVKTLDEYTQIDATRPLVIKLDTQGSEARILNGAQRRRRACCRPPVPHSTNSWRACGRWDSSPHWSTTSVPCSGRSRGSGLCARRWTAALPRRTTKTTCCSSGDRTDWWRRS